MTLAPRQIHLDFHTSEAIPDIAANFDPRTFAETARKAEASSRRRYISRFSGIIIPRRPIPSG